MEVGENRNGERQAYQQMKVDNRKTACFLILEFLSVTYFSLAAVDFNASAMFVDL